MIVLVLSLGTNTKQLILFVSGTVDLNRTMNFYIISL